MEQGLPGKQGSQPSQVQSGRREKQEGKRPQVRMRAALCHGRPGWSPGRKPSGVSSPPGVEPNSPGRTQSQGQRDPGWREAVLGSWVELCDPYWATFNIGHILSVSTHMNNFIHFFKS